MKRVFQFTLRVLNFGYIFRKTAQITDIPTLKNLSASLGSDGSNMIYGVLGVYKNIVLVIDVIVMVLSVDMIAELVIKTFTGLVLAMEALNMEAVVSLDITEPVEVLYGCSLLTD